MNLKEMTIEELRGLDHALKLEMDLRKQKLSANFSIDDEVEFTHGQVVIKGKIVRCNQKSASILVPPNVRWNVSWTYVRKAA